MTRLRRLAVGAAFGVLAACTSEAPPDLADWSFHFSDNTPVLSLPHVPSQDRTRALPLERNLVLREAFGVPLFRPVGVGVSESGDIYVLDQGNHRVVVFDAQGEARRAIGRAGGGPGEFEWPNLISVVGAQVLLHSPRIARLSVFGLEGNHLADYSVPGSFSPELIAGSRDMLIVVDAKEPMLMYGGREPWPAPWIVGQYSLDGQLIAKIIEFEQRPRAYWTTDQGAGEIPVRDSHPRAAASDEAVYVTDGREYQVLALKLNGDPVWALRVAYTAPGPNDQFKQALIQFGSSRPRGYRTPAAPGSYVWPDRFATIENLEVDGNGFLYVFPHANRSPEEWQEVHRPVPVDVYTSKGERIFSGWSGIEDWDAAVGDHLYRVERDPETEEYIVARYRLDTEWE